MSILSWAGGQLGGLLGASTEGADNAHAKVQNLINSGALNQAANLGLTTRGAGAPAWDASQALTKQNVGLDTTAMDADQAKLAPITQHYLDQFRNGGMEGQAAIEAAQQAAAFHAQGGIGGIHQNIMNSQGLNAQVGDVAEGERVAGGNQANNLDALKASTALQKAMFAASVSHSNFLKNLGAQNTTFGLQNLQDNMHNKVNETINNVQNATDSTAIDQKAAQGKIGTEILDALTSAASGLGGTIASANSAPYVPAPVNTLTQVAPPQVVEGSGTSAGYLQPAASIGRAIAPPSQSAIFKTGPSLPSTANFWNRNG